MDQRSQKRTHGIDWLLLGGLTILVMRKGSAPPQASDGGPSLAGAARRSTLPRIVFALALAATALACGLWAWLLVPPERSLPDPTGGLTGSIFLDRDTVLSGFDVSLAHLEDDNWQVLIVLTADTALEGHSAQVTLRDVVLGSCELLAEESKPTDFGGRSSCNRSQPTAVASEVRGYGSWGHIASPEEGVDGGTDQGFRAVVVLVVKMTPDQAGVLEREWTMRVATPALYVQQKRGSSGNIRTRFTVVTHRSPAMEWSGLAPSEVAADHVAWSYDTDRFSPTRSLSHGSDPTVVARDQQGTFWAGVLAGVAVSTVLAACQVAFEALMLRK